MESCREGVGRVGHGQDTSTNEGGVVGVQVGELGENGGNALEPYYKKVLYDTSCDV